jgi:hypothetical protein
LGLNLITGTSTILGRSDDVGRLAASLLWTKRLSKPMLGGIGDAGSIGAGPFGIQLSDELGSTEI